MKFVHSPIAKLLMLVVLMVAPLVSRADIISMSGTIAQASEQDVLFNDAQSGSTVLGVTSLTNNQVWFSSFTDVLATSVSNQSILRSANPRDPMNQVAVSVAGMSFTSLTLDPLMLLADSSLSGPFDLTVTFKTTTGTYTYTLPMTDPLTNGDHVISFVAASGTLINEVDLASTSGFNTLSQIKLGGLIAATPEPASLLLLGLGATLLPVRLRRRS